ncbi:MAG: TIGR03118 family protein [Chitinophagales bacterium]
MKKITHRVFVPPLNVFLVLLMVFTIFDSCRKGEEQKFLNGYKQTNLVADTLGFNAAIIDPNLVNAWGISLVPSGPIWISANHTSLSTIYNRTGMALRPPVTILGGGGAPTGQLFNSTTSFVLTSNGLPAKFIFAGEDGTITAWNGGNDAGVAADRSKWGAVYKGIAMGNDGTGNFLYATNFKGQKVDVFDSAFNYVADKPFEDKYIPPGYGPFNIRNINGSLYVTYAKLKGPDNEDDQKGPGNGFVDIFTTKGIFVKRFASRGALNSPWGIVQSAMGVGNVPNAILVGNFGDGRINVYSQDGNFIGPLRDNYNHPIQIEGLWAIENNVPGGDPNQLFFTAGPDDESHGLFGYLSK